VKRRILHTIKLDAIAAVDRPCQEGARAAIIKRESDDVTTISKKDHDDAIAKMIADHDAAVKKLQGEHTSALDVVNKSVADLKAELEKARMTDEEREHMEALDEEKKKKFLAKSAADRKAEVQLAKGADEQITINGTVIRKAKVGAESFAAFKSMHEQSEANKLAVTKAKDEAETARLEKRADDEFGKLPGTATEKAQVLKAVASAPEAVRLHLEKMLKAGQDAIAKGFERMGHGGGRDADPSIKKAADDFNGAVAKIQKRDDCSKSVALQKAAIEHPDLLKAYNEANRQAA